MHTKCPNSECGQEYKIKSEMVGVTARCRKCNSVFEIQPFEKKVIIDLGEDVFSDEVSEDDTNDEKRGRRSSQEIIQEKIEDIRIAVNEMMPLLSNALERKENESNTRLILNKMLQKVLGYSIEDMKTEQKIEGRKADYVLSIKGEDSLVIEAKRIGANLREQQIFQATSYGAQSGIKWVVLTNAVVWQLYHISTCDRIETDLVFTIELRDGLDDDEAYFFYLISKDGMSRKNLLLNLWQKISTLCYDNIVTAILSEDVISKIRSTLSKQTGFNKVTNDDVRNVIEENIFQL